MSPTCSRSSSANRDSASVFPPTAHVGMPTLGPAGVAPRRVRVARERAAASGFPSTRCRRSRRSAACGSPAGGSAPPRASSLGVRGLRARGAFPQAPLADAQERLIAYATGERGFHCRTVLNMEHADISHTALEFKLDQLSSTTPGYPVEQIQFLHRAGRMGRGSALDLARMYVRLNHPKAVERGRALHSRSPRRAVHRAEVARHDGRERPDDRRPMRARAFPPPASVVIYVVWDRRGGVEDYVPYALTRLRVMRSGSSSSSMAP